MALIITLTQPRQLDAKAPSFSCDGKILQGFLPSPQSLAEENKITRSLISYCGFGGAFWLGAGLAGGVALESSASSSQLCPFTA